MKNNLIKIGMIGYGDMGKLYATKFAAAGLQVFVSDLAHKMPEIEQSIRSLSDKIKVLPDGREISQTCDLVIYSVEAKNIAQAVEAYGPFTRPDAIVGGQTAVKSLEIAAFEKYLPQSAHIITLHSLHGPGVDPKGQALIVIRHRADDDAYARASLVFDTLESVRVELESFEIHDRMMADTQAVTHLGFESMGTAWKNAGIFPWENPSYLGGIDNVKILMALRIYAGKSHVYSDLAILNPYARDQVAQYAASESELFKLMIQEKETEFRTRIQAAREFVFGSAPLPSMVTSKVSRKGTLLLNDKVLGEYALGTPPHFAPDFTPDPQADIKAPQRKPNSHLSLLAMVDAWYQMKVNPYEHMICRTPVYRLRLGIVEYLFCTPALLDESIQAALYDKAIRADDLEFHTAVREWSALIQHQDVAGYRTQFETTQNYFKDRLAEGLRRSNDLIKKLV